MIERDDFDRQVVAWLADDAGDDAPDYLAVVLDRVERTPRRPTWTAIPSWRPVERTLRRLDVAPALLIVLLLGLLLVASFAVAILGGSNPRPRLLLGLPAPSAASSELPSETPGWPEAERAAQLEFRGSDFYTIPRPLAPAEPGAVVSVQRMDESSHRRVLRVLYHSRSVSDRDIAVSGTIWIPTSLAPPDGYPIVSFAMGDDGSGDMCAMSRFDAFRIDASYGGLMSLLLDEGYVVAYTDYEGLGTSDPYPFAVLESAAHAMLDAARAGGELLGAAASDRVVLVGDGFFGGDAATTAGERAADYAPDLDVRGVIAADGGGGDYEATLRDLVATGGSAGVSGLIQAIDGFSVAYPELRPEDILTPLGLDDIRLLDTTCWTQLHGLIDRQSTDDVLAVNPLEGPSWAKRIAAMTVSTAPYPTLLMATGKLEKDAGLRGLAARFCRGNNAVLLHDYPAAQVGARDMGHDPLQGVFVVSWPDARRWIADRFAGTVPVGNCNE
jgi:hypothetical protein